MNILKTLLFAILLLPGFDNQPKGKIPPWAIKGDFDGDGKPEFAWIVKPIINADNNGCEGDSCVAHLVFSTPRFKTISLKNCIGAGIINLGPLNDDGRDVIGLRPETFTGCWHDYITYTFKNGKWQYFVPPFPTHCNQWENNETPIERIPNEKGYVLIRYSEFEKNDIVVKKKVVKAL